MRLISAGFGSGNLGKNKGSREAPKAILSELKKFILNERGHEIIFEEEEIAIDQTNIDETNQSIEKACHGRDFILLGGDHSITYSAFKGFAKSNQGAGLVVLDAHADVQSDFKPPTHEDYLRALIDEGILPPERVVIVGLRNVSKEEKAYLKEKRIKSFPMHDMVEDGIWDACDSLMEVAKAWPSLYLSIDIDCLDPAFAPGTGYPEPGGLSTREALVFIRRLTNMANLKAADLVEVDPSRDPSGQTVRAAAKLVSELL